jgi:hypothetical protein
MPSPATELRHMKAASHEALQRALAAQPAMHSTLVRWWNETQQCAEHVPKATQVVIYWRTGTLFELLVDRAQWRR